MNIKDEADSMRKNLDAEMKAIVSVALFGQPGAGKSSLINAIVGKTVMEVGVETDKTVEKAAYEHNGVKLVDLPGYGTANFPKHSYFDKFDIPSFDLFLCVTSGKMHDADSDFFQELSSRGKVCIFVVNKHDDLWEDGIPIEELEKRKKADIEKHVKKSDIQVIFTSCRKKTGLDQLNTAIQDNLGGAKKERWLRGAKAYSEKFLADKKEACEKYVIRSAGLSALNGINPIPGVDVSVDLGILFTLFKDIRESYGLSDDVLASMKQSAYSTIGHLANDILKYATREGLLMLLKSFAGRATVKTVSKFVPFVGQAVAASVGYGVTYGAGTKYLNECHELASVALSNNLGLK